MTPKYIHSSWACHREYEDDAAGSLKMSTFVKNKFEERYGLYWHCSVGNYKQEHYRDFCDLKRDHSFQVLCLHAERALGAELCVA